MGTDSEVDMIMLMLMLIPAYIIKTAASSIELRRTFDDSVEAVYSSLKYVTDDWDCVFEDIVLNKTINLRFIDRMCFGTGAGGGSIV